jgi:hypothetical protein
VNAVFIDSAEFDRDLVSNLHGLAFRENYSHAREYKMNWQRQFELIKDFDFVEFS